MIDALQEQVGITDAHIAAVEAFIASCQVPGGSRGLPTDLTTDPVRNYALRALVLAGISCRDGHGPEAVKERIGSMGGDPLVRKALLPEAVDKVVEAQIEAQFPAAVAPPGDDE